MSSHPIPHQHKAHSTKKTINLLPRASSWEARRCLRFADGGGLAPLKPHTPNQVHHTMRTKRLITAILAGPLAILFALVAYSSANSILWTHFQDFVARSHQGSTKPRDLSPWSSDLAWAWANDFIQFEHNTTDDPTAHLLFGLSIDADVFRLDVGFGLVYILFFTVAMCLAAFVVPLIATRLSASPKSTGLSREFFQEPNTRSRLISIQSNAVLIFVVTAPMFAIFSWYLTYDRIQSSFDLPSGTTRWARYIHNSFSPQPIEWPFLLILPMLVAFIYVYFQSKQFIKDLPQETRLKHQKHCPNRKCRYQLDPSIHTCPECGLRWKDSITTTKSHTRWSNKKRVLIILTLIALPAITLASLSRTHRYEIHNWITLRQDNYNNENLYLTPSRPVRLQWNNDTLWITTIIDPAVEPRNPENLAYTLITVYQFNNQPPTIIPSVFPQFTQYISSKNSRVLDVSPYNQFDRYTPSNTTFTTFQLIQTPDTILGFPAGQPLTSQANDFLVRAKAIVAP